MAVKNDLKKLRKEQRLKQSDLAMAVGMCEKSISNIELEKNPASLETALRLAAYFKVSVEDIFHLEEEHTTRKCDDTVMLFDEYLHSINLSEKSIDEQVIEAWIKKISDGISINTVGGHVHYIRQLLLFLIDNGYYCFIPKTIASKDTYVPYLYTDHDIEAIFKVADSFTAPHAVKNKSITYEMPLLLRLLFCCGMRVSDAYSAPSGI